MSTEIAERMEDLSKSQHEHELEFVRFQATSDET